MKIKEYSNGWKIIEYNEEYLRDTLEANSAKGRDFCTETYEFAVKAFRCSRVPVCKNPLDHKIHFGAYGRVGFEI